MRSDLWLVCACAVAAVCVLVVPVRGQQGNCKTLDPCSCQYEDGVVVNLTSLRRTDGPPNFANQSDGHGDVYSWNPCTPFTIMGPNNNTQCTDVAVCMVRQGFPNPLYYNLGKQDSAVFAVDDNGTLTLTYTADNGDFKRSTVILMQCMDQSIFDFFVVDGEQDINNDTIVYTMTLASKWACAYAPNINPAQPVQHNGLDGGAIFAIVLFSLIGAYIVFGVAYQAFVKKESGVRLIPNHDFWCAIPRIFTDKKTSIVSGEKPGKGGQYESI